MTFAPSIECALAALQSVEPVIKAKAQAAFIGQMRSRIDPEDVLQQAAIKIVRNLDQCHAQTEDDLNGWVFRIAENEVQNARTTHIFRSKRTILSQKFSLDADVSVSGISSGSDVSVVDGLIYQERLAAIKQATVSLEQTCPRQGMVVRMFYFEGRSVEQIAETMGITASAVRTLKSRGLERIRQADSVSTLAD